MSVEYPGKYHGVTSTHPKPNTLQKKKSTVLIEQHWDNKTKQSMRFPCLKDKFSKILPGQEQRLKEK